tara:strand:+ start:270 stop:440 length:171 start_codon:yes stop_codon:yes gene_type:complete
MLRWLVAITPMAGALMFPILVPVTIVKYGVANGVLLALFLSVFWFVAMLRTSEMPH